MKQELEFVILEKLERMRTYIYKDGFNLEIKNVISVSVRPSGSHRLETSDGEKWIVLPGFIAIKLDVDEWTF